MKAISRRFLNAVLIAAAIFLALIAMRAIGAVDAVDRFLWEQRFTLSDRSVSESIVFVDIDAQSLEELNIWPLPRRLYAELTETIASAGAIDILFDIDFSSASNPEDDQIFAQAIEKVGNVSLAAFRQAASSDGDATQAILNQPIEPFLNAAWPVVVMVPVERDSRIWRNLYGYPLAGSSEVSAAAFLGGYTGEPAGAFWLDYSIAIEQLDTVSFVDVLKERVPTEFFQDKRVIVGASAQELRDIFPVPVHDLLPGPLIQALGAETILQDRALSVRGEGLTIAAALAIFFAFMMTRVAGLWIKLSILLLGVVALESTGYLVLQLQPYLLSTASAQILLALTMGVVVFRELGFQKLLSQLSQIGHRNSERILGQVFDDSFDAILVLDARARITAASKIARDMFKIKKNSVTSARDVLPPELVDEAISILQAPMGTRPVLKTLVLPTRGGKQQYIEYVVRRSEKMIAKREGIKRQDKEAVACLTCRDVTEERQATNKLAYLAKYDPVTTLLNRNGFEERLQSDIGSLAGAGANVCVVQIAISNLDQIIASLGHSYGDRVRQTVASRLKNQFGQDMCWAALSTDVIACSLKNSVELLKPRDFVNSAQEVLGKDYMVEGARISVRLDFGFIVDDGSHDADWLLKKSGNALALARRDPNTNVRSFLPEMDAALERRRYLETELFKAVVRDELRMVYQPMVDMSSGVVVAAEALLRWRHHELGEVSPGEFIPIAEENGYIVELGSWALNRSMKEASTWRQPVRLSINVSAIQFSRDNFAVTVKEALERTGYPAERLDLEITESLFVDESIDLKAEMDTIRKYGCRFSLDDFGTGYASLGYIPKYPFSKLKVDRSFIENICTSNKDAALVRAVLDLAKAYEMETVMEGIETEEQAAMLVDLGCTIGQGFLYGRPVDAREFRALFKTAA